MHSQNAISARASNLIENHVTIDEKELINFIQEFYVRFYILVFPSLTLCLDFECSLRSRVASLLIKWPTKSKKIVILSNSMIVSPAIERIRIEVPS